jgi:hypothetical protein
MKLTDWMKSIKKTELSNIAKLVLYNLATYMNNDCGISSRFSEFPSISQQMQDCSLCKPSIHKGLSEAVAAGLLKINQCKGIDNRFRNNYTAVNDIDYVK